VKQTLVVFSAMILCGLAAWHSVMANAGLPKGTQGFEIRDPPNYLLKEHQRLMRDCNCTMIPGDQRK